MSIHLLLTSLISIKTVLFIITAFLIINIQIEKRQYSSKYAKKIHLLQIVSIVIALLIVTLMVILFRVKYLAITVNIFYLFSFAQYQIEIVLFSIITFELLYDFVFTKNKINFTNIKPYLILYGYLIILDIIVFSTHISFITFITNLIYIAYLYNFISNKNNTIVV